MRLLLVEDDHILGSSLTKALEKHAYGVDWLQEGESALAALSDCVFAAAILDINLPKMNGLSRLAVLQPVHAVSVFLQRFGQRGAEYMIVFNK